MTHEYQERNISYSDRTSQQMRKEVVRVINNRNVGFFKFSDDPVKKQKKIEALANTFIAVYNQALQHQ